MARCMASPPSGRSVSTRRSLAIPQVLPELLPSCTSPWLVPVQLSLCYGALVSSVEFGSFESRPASAPCDEHHQHPGRVFSLMPSTVHFRCVRQRFCVDLHLHHHGHAPVHLASVSHLARLHRRPSLRRLELAVVGALSQHPLPESACRRLDPWLDRYHLGRRPDKDPIPERVCCRLHCPAADGSPSHAVGQGDGAVREEERCLRESAGIAHLPRQQARLRILHAARRDDGQSLE